MQGRSLFAFIPRTSPYALFFPPFSSYCTQYASISYPYCLIIAAPDSLAYGTAVERVRHGP